jgi:hypothetical protein
MDFTRQLVCALGRKNEIEKILIRAFGLRRRTRELTLVDEQVLVNGTPLPPFWISRWVSQLFWLSAC